MSKNKTQFTRKEWDELKAAQRQISDLHPTMDKAENCGVDCTEMRAIAAEILSRLSAIEREFFPTVPER